MLNDLLLCIVAHMILLEVCPLDNLPLTYFLCRKCNQWMSIETLGVVVAGPSCPKCRKSMRRVQLVQQTLELKIPNEQST